MPGDARKTAVLSLGSQVFISLVKAADSLTRDVEELLKEYSLTGTQYNVLRILRGAEPQGLACREVVERMISHDPDMTRLLDRMEKRGLITRARGEDDRRVVRARATRAALALLRRLDEPVRLLHDRQFRGLSAAQLKLLAQLLDLLAARMTR